MKSEYLERFQEARKHFKLPGSKLLVEKLELGEIKSKGGIIMATSSHIKSTLKTNEPMVCMVLATGEGYTNEDGSVVPLSVKSGNVVVVNNYGVSFFSTLPGVASYSEMKVGLTTENDVQLAFDSVEAFQKYSGALQCE